MGMNRVKAQELIQALEIISKPLIIKPIGAIKNYPL
jgi:hypothetical protein